MAVTPRERIDVLLVAGALSQRIFRSRKQEKPAEDQEDCGQTQPMHRRSIASTDSVVFTQLWWSAGHMIREVRRVLLVGVMAAAALSSCGMTTTKTVTTSAPGPSASSSSSASAGTSSSTNGTPVAGPVYFQGAAGAPLQRPVTLPLTADGTLFVLRARWTSWGGATATGTGTAEYHGCQPSCAEAQPHHAPVSILLSGVRACASRQYYSRVILTQRSGQQLDRPFLQHRNWSPC
jgi:hypothetical protein